MSLTAIPKAVVTSALRLARLPVDVASNAVGLAGRVLGGREPSEETVRPSRAADSVATSRDGDSVAREEPGPAQAAEPAEAEPDLAAPEAERDEEPPQAERPIKRGAGTGFPEPPGKDPGDRSKDPTPYSSLNNPVGEPDPTEYPDPYETREDPRDPEDPDGAPFGQEPHPPTGSRSTSEPHPAEDPDAQALIESRDRDNLDS